MKHILINIQNLKKEHGGIYQYSVALLKTLSKVNTNYKFFVLYEAADNEIKKIVNEALNLEFTKTKTPTYSKSILLAFKICNKLFKLFSINKKISIKDLFDNIIKDYNISIIHSPTQTIILKENVKNISTLHDVQELHYPEFFTSEERAFRASHYKKAIDNADAVVVSYNHVKHDIIKYFNKPKEKVHTILLNMEDLWFDNLKTKSKQVLNAYNLPQAYLLCPASTWEHKNHLRLIEAIKQIDDPKMHLICTGHQTTYFTEKILPYIKDEELDNKIKFLGIVSDEVLFELYHNCKAVVVPTLYEAGSFPLMESILMGIPVICSNVTSLPETIGDNRFVFDPLSISDIASKISSIWNDADYIKDNLELSKIQAEKLKNNNAASKICNIYESI